ncbi:phospholipase D alpha 1 [Actinidia rufa]|uniref:phospholipase D n=1 Tax=Actinidia rufa TaxID=165716 RepID=A0A7J0GAZ2_9ERIC|nr:phospholipase D alpha 1 [Actinidia rufa]
MDLATLGDELSHIYCAHKASNVIFTVKDDNPIGATLIGRAYVPVEELRDGEEVDRSLQIVIVLVELEVLSSPEFHTHSTHRDKGCQGSLYQYSHVPDNFIPKIPLAEGKYYEPHRCWEVVFDAISNAKHVIYITSWSVYTEISLIRDSRRQKPGGDIIRGGSRILVVGWVGLGWGTVAPATALLLPPLDITLEGWIDGHTTKKLNNCSKTPMFIVFYACPRNPDDGGSIVQDLQISTMFTHHQKIVVVDSEMPPEGSQKWRIVSFVGVMSFAAEDTIPPYIHFLRLWTQLIMMIFNSPTSLVLQSQKVDQVSLGTTSTPDLKDPFRGMFCNDCV